LGKVVFHWDDLRQNAFDSTSLRLAAIAGTDAFSYCITDHNNVLCACKGFVADRKFHFFDKPLGYLDRVTADDDLLYADFSSVRLAVRGVPFVMMRAEDASHDAVVARLQEITDLSKSDEIFTDITDEGLAIAFALPQVFASEVHVWFSEASIIHLISALVICGMKYSHGLAQPVMMLNVSDGFTEVILCDNGRLLFANHYKTQGHEDVLYYALAVLQNLRIESDKVLVRCSGPAAIHAVQFLQTYISQVQHFSYPGIDYRDDYPQVETLDLISIARCAS
jgi:hypothetical protein